MHAEVALLENDQQEQKEITQLSTVMKTAIPWAHALALLSPSGEVRGFGGAATSTHRALQRTIRAHSAELLTAWPPAEGPGAGLDVTDTQRKESGHRVRPHLTHGHGDGRRAAPSPPLTHTNTHTHTHTHTHTDPWVIISADESKAWQARTQTPHREITLLQQQVWPHSNVRELLRGGKRIMSCMYTQPNRTGQGHVIYGGVQSDSH